MKKFTFLMIAVFWIYQSCLGKPSNSDSGRISRASKNYDLKTNLPAMPGEMLVGPSPSVPAVETQLAPSQKEISLGIKMGLSCSWLYSNKTTIIERKYPFGYSFGLVIEIPLCPRLSIASGLSFSSEKQKLLAGTSEEDNYGYQYQLKSHYFDVPIDLNLYLFSTQRMYLNAGLLFRALSKAMLKNEHLLADGWILTYNYRAETVIIILI